MSRRKRTEGGLLNGPAKTCGLIDEWEASAGTLRESKDEIREQYEFLAKVLDSFPHPVYAIDAQDYTIKKASPSSLLPHSPEESTCYGLFHKRSEPCRDPGQPCPLEEVKKTKKAVVVDHIHHDKDGNTRYVEINAYPILDRQGNVAEVIQYQSDITERKKAEETVKELAYRDPLTGLPNRRIFSERLTLEIAHAWRDRQRLAVMFLDLDHFKDVNDMLGHDIGDKLLQAVAIRLRSLLRRSDTLARLGGDEFLLILSELTRVKDANKIAQKILEAFQGPFLVRSYEVYMGASIGIATYPKDGGIPDILIKRADIAMYQAKKAGRNNYRSYSMTPDSEHLSEREASEGKTKQVKTMLQQKEEEYRSLAADIGNVIWTSDSRGNTTFISPSVKRVYGYTPEEIYRQGARLWFARTHPDDVQQVKEAYKRLFEKGERFNIQYRIKRKDERWIWLHHRAVATYERDGVLYADGVLSDITESKRGEETLRKAEEMLSGITERNFDAIYELDLEGHATYVSPAVKRILGYKPEEVLGEFLQDHIPEGEMPKAAQALATVKKGRNIEGLQLEVVKKDGSRASVEINASPIMRNGEVIGCQGIFRDITQRKKAEEELEESRSHFQSLFNLMVDPVVIVDGKGKILDLTNGVQKVTGFKREELLGKNFMTTKVVTAKSKAILVKNLAKRMMGLKIAPYEIEILTKDGKKMPIEANAAKITYRGKPADMAVFRDITERKKVEETLRESEEKFRNLSERSPNMIFINKKGRAVYANERCEEAMGYKRDEFYSPDFDFLTLIAPESKELIKSAFNRHMSGKEVKPYEYALITKDGKRIEAIITTKLISYEGESAILGIVTDITDHKKTKEELQSTLKKLRRALRATIQAMAVTVEMKDAYTAGHQRRVTNLASAIAKEMHLSGDEIDGIRMAGSIHDIGKIGVPAEILNKPVRLAHMEFELIKTHPAIGYNILKEIQFPWPVATIVLQHHERIDGSGYPDGLSGDDILIEARILGVADVVEALASHRPYRPALGIDKALEEVREKRGTLYDQEVVDTCLKLFTKKRFKLD